MIAPRLKPIAAAFAALLCGVAAAEQPPVHNPYALQLPGGSASIEMVPIPAGRVLLGSPSDEPGRSKAEGPQVAVDVPAFWMASHETTWAAYRQFMALYDPFVKFRDAGIRQPASHDDLADAVTAPTPLYEPGFTFKKGDADDQPAVSMTQYAARQFTKWLSLSTGQFYRLPTEAEWEYAARAGTTTAFSFGDDEKKLGDYAWYFDNSEDLLHAVGGRKPNAFGLYDMHGNVGEWVIDAYDADWYATLAPGPVSASEAVNFSLLKPKYVVRGGSWWDEPLDCRSAARLKSRPLSWSVSDPNEPRSPWWFTEEQGLAVGFRIVRPLVEPDAETKIKYWEPNAAAVIRAVKNKLFDGRGVAANVDEKLAEDISQLQPAGQRK